MIKILIVDDLFDNIITLQALLSDCLPDAEVLTASSGKAAVQMACQQQPDIVLLDILMPGMDGFEVCKVLKADVRCQDIPVVFVSAIKETKSSRIKALSVGVDGFLTKPIDELELRAQLNAMLKIKEANDIKRGEKEYLETLVKERTDKLELELEERKKVQNELVWAKQSWEVTFDAINDGIMLVDKDQIIQQCNLTFTRLLEKPKDEIIGQHCLYMVHGLYHAIEECPFIQMQNSKKRETMELVFNGRDYEITVDPVFDEKGALKGAVHIFKDITVYNEAKEAIQKERHLLLTVIDNLPSAIYVKDREGRKLVVNKADLDNIGIDNSEEVLGKNDLELFGGEIGQRGMNDDFHVMDNDAPFFDHEERFEHSNGQMSWLLTSKLPLKDPDGKVIGLIGIGHNITSQKELIEELKRAKIKAEESDRLKSAFLTNMSHEIRTPMNGILGFSSLLKNANLSSEKKENYIKNIEKSGARMLNTVNDIIEMSKIEVGEVVISASSFDLHATIKDICDFFRPEANNKGLDIVNAVPHADSEFFINSDVSKVESIITNLIKNAIKYSDKGIISFGYVQDKGNLEFYCKDDGIGIPKNRLAAIFNRFEQADIEDRHVFQGSGLGLAITQAYVNMLGGRIWVESELDKGSTFYFTLPKVIVYHEEIEEIENFNKENIMTYKKKNILIVDDDEISIAFLEILLEPYAKELYTAANGKEAVEICRSNEVDIVFMDMKMPIMNGYEATQKIREFAPDLPIIAQTAYALAGDREKAIEAGCTDYVSKPINEAKLLQFLGMEM